jgi:hypothetical protein
VKDLANATATEASLTAPGELVAAVRKILGE